MSLDRQGRLLVADGDVGQYEVFLDDTCSSRAFLDFSDSSRLLLDWAIKAFWQNHAVRQRPSYGFPAQPGSRAAHGDFFSCG